MAAAAATRLGTTLRPLSGVTDYRDNDPPRRNPSARSRGIRLLRMRTFDHGRREGGTRSAAAALLDLGIGRLRGAVLGVGHPQRIQHDRLRRALLLRQYRAVGARRARAAVLRSEERRVGKACSYR